MTERRRTENEIRELNFQASLRFSKMFCHTANLQRKWMKEHTPIRLDEDEDTTEPNYCGGVRFNYSKPSYE